MSEFNHDPAEYIRGIQQLLISDKKRLRFLFGAGSSLAKKNDKSLVVPTIGQMTKNIVAEVIRTNKKFETALSGIKKELAINFNIVTV